MRPGLHNFKRGTTRNFQCSFVPLADFSSEIKLRRLPMNSVPRFPHSLLDLSSKESSKFLLLSKSLWDLFKVQPICPTFAGVTLVLTAVALAASYIPALRAMRLRSNHYAPLRMTS
jgi:hypothetical protein